MYIVCTKSLKDNIKVQILHIVKLYYINQCRQSRHTPISTLVDPYSFIL
jgi:hypothetical protein